MSEHVIVIGSGFGGLASALRARKMGFDVTVIERLDQLGGRAQTFERNGFVFDAGPTVITAPFLFDELFELFDRKIEDYVEILPVTPWYRYEFNDGTHLNYGGSVEDTLREIERINPADVEGYKKLLAHSEKIFDVGFSQLAHVP
ncbi:NAD(P)-binding protein, partial [Gammaproteobacteria bacterium]|nr:NAD(P)-binding protein [Gammaproteobacteria bacterium]